MMADPISVFGSRKLFFCESTSFYHIFSILRLQLRILDYDIGKIFEIFFFNFHV